MRRTLAFTMALLVLGTASAVAVAWLTAGVMKLEVGGWDLISWEGRYVPRAEGPWFVSHSSDWGRRAWVIHLNEPPPWRPRYGWAPTPASWSRAWEPWAHEDRNRRWLECEFGWPTHWMRFRAEDVRERSPVDRSIAIETGIAIEPLSWSSDAGAASAAIDLPGWGESS